MTHLNIFLEAQQMLQENSFGMRLEKMTDEERIEYIRWNVVALEHELHEALDETGWKPWAQSRHINREAYVGELIDAFHFLMNLLLAVGASDVEVTEKYWAKHKVNQARQESGTYNGFTEKDSDGRALDEPHITANPNDGPDCERQYDAGSRRT
jgi:dimeric dUTPase (all-alpha-NTP-PPase superfamily)